MPLKASQIGSSGTENDRHIALFSIVIILFFYIDIEYLMCFVCPPYSYMFIGMPSKEWPLGQEILWYDICDKKGDPCQRWDSRTPHSHKCGELADHENHCRNPDDDNSPWCYTTSSDKRYDYCTVLHW